MGRVPLLLPLTALVAGILAAEQWVALWMALIVASLIAAVGLWIFHRHTAALFSLFVGIGALASVASAPSAPPSMLPSGQPCMATVLSVREEAGSRRIRCRADGVGDVLLRLYGAFPEVGEGNRISFNCTLTPYESPEPIVPDELVYADDGVVAAGVVTESEIEVTDSRLTPRRRLMNLIVGSGVDDRTGAMLCALLLGEPELLGDGVRSRFAAAGISHVLALSGLHVGVITMLIAMALWPLYVGRHNRTRRILTIAALWGYAALTGFSPSVTRAVIMASVYMFGRVIERPGVPMNSLCLAAIVILAFDPGALRSVSFQLSFAAVAGILTFYPLINCVDRRNHPWLHRIVGYPAVSVSAMAFTGILSAYYFHSYPLFFLLANLAISPLIPPLIFGGAFLVALSAAGFPTEWLCALLDRLTEAACWIAETVEAIPGHSVGGLYFSPFVILPAFAALTMLAVGGWKRRPAPLVAAAALAVLAFQTDSLTASEFPVREHYFLRDHTATNVLIRNGDELYLLTSAGQPGVRADILADCSRRFCHYMARRRIGELKVFPDTMFTDFASRRGDCFSIDGARYMFLKRNTQKKQMRIDYLVVTRGFTGDVTEAAANFCPDSAVILSSALDRRRLLRYGRELEEAKIKYITY